MRAVLDVNVLIAAVLSANGAPAAAVRAWLDGAYELVVSPLVLEELERALRYPKLRRRVSTSEARELVDLLGSAGDLRDDPQDPPRVVSADPGDDYLVALAAATRSVIVSGDRHLLDLCEDLPVYSPREFLEFLRTVDGDGEGRPGAGAGS
ncbi:MAG TPA: putative toxin-antitoxin system toxin component, PIN family [Nitriliruptorales bacterium]